MSMNSLNIHTLVYNDPLFLVRYSTVNYPDYINVFFKSYNPDRNNIEIITPTNKIKKISIEKAKYRLFIDKNEMARGLFVCFIKRNIKPMPEYFDLFRNSQDNNPELWI